MAFSETIKDEIFKRSGGQCECTRKHEGLSAPHHGGRCSATFTRHGNWEAHHIVSQNAGGADTKRNGEALCVKCHELTRSYGNNSFNFVTRLYNIDWI